MSKAELIHCFAARKTGNAIDLIRSESVVWFNRSLEPLGYELTAKLRQAITCEGAVEPFQPGS